jgi:hypothetical protein
MYGRGSLSFRHVAGAIERDKPMLERLRAFFGGAEVEPPDARQLPAVSANQLSTALHATLSGQRGWITLRDAWRLFSTLDEAEAFGELDDAGKAVLAEFATAHRSSVEFMPVQDRVYFIRRD